MAILYAMVARGNVVLAEFSAVTGNAGAVARRILEKLPAEADSRLCFSQDRYIFHILRSDGLTFVCMANDTFGRATCDTFKEILAWVWLENWLENGNPLGQMAAHNTVGPDRGQWVGGGDNEGRPKMVYQW